MKATVLMWLAGLAAFALLVWGLTVLLMRSDHYAEQQKFQKACIHDGYFVDYRSRWDIRCIDGHRNIIRQYYRP